MTRRDDRARITRGLARVRGCAARAARLEADGEYLDALEEVRAMLDEVTVLRAAFVRESDRVNRVDARGDA